MNQSQTKRALANSVKIIPNWWRNLNNNDYLELIARMSARDVVDYAEIDSLHHAKINLLWSKIIQRNTNYAEFLIMLGRFEDEYEFNSWQHSSVLRYYEKFQPLTTEAYINSYSLGRLQDGYRYTNIGYVKSNVIKYIEYL